MNYKVSVIVPVYNVETYLEECLNSLVKQTLDDLEIIIVNDGSTDHSQDIIDEFQTRYPNRIKSYKKPNGGLADTRNFGINKAQGEYIGFIDSDDYVELDMYERLYEFAQKLNSDLVVCDLEYNFEDSKRNYVQAGYVPKLRKDPQHALFLAPLFAWNKLYKRSLFEQSNLRYPVGLWYEDILVTVPLFALANKVDYYPGCFVHYRQRSSSIMGSKTNPKMVDIFTVLNQTIQWFKEKHYFEDYHDELEYLAIEHWLLYGGFRFLRSNDWKALTRLAFKTLKQEFPSWRKNPYLKTLKFSYRLYLISYLPVTVSLYRWLLSRKDSHA